MLTDLCAPLWWHEVDNIMHGEKDYKYVDGKVLERNLSFL